MIRVPLDQPTLLRKGVAYSIELRQSGSVDGSTYIAHMRPWSTDDVEPPIILRNDTMADHVTLRSIPR